MTDEQQHLIMICLSSASSSELLKIEHEMYLDWSFWFFMLLLLLCNYVVVVHLSLYIHIYRWTTTKLPSNNKKNNNKKINLHKLFNPFLLMIRVCYCVILLLLFLFICSCGSTITDEQQQHETVTTTTSDLSTAFSIAFCIMSSWPEVVLLLATRCPYEGVHLTVHCLCNCIPQHVKMTLCGTALGHQMPLLGGTSASKNLNTLCISCFASQMSVLRKTNNKCVYTKVVMTSQFKSWTTLVHIVED